MKIFLDSADISEIKEIYDLGIIDGLTTNPSLIAKGSKNFHETIKQICQIIVNDVSIEVTATIFKDMIQEAEKILSISNNIVIKLPMNWEAIKACKYFAQKNIKVNMTLCFSANQALLAAKSGASFISPFIGRLEDIGGDGIKLVRDIKNIYNQYNFTTKIIAASIRSPNHFYQCLTCGVDIVTLPGKIIKQLISNPLTDIGLKTFEQDWKQANLSI